MSSSLPLASRTAIITGASAGIGQAVAHHLASLGANLVINARRAALLDHVAALIRSDCPNIKVATAPGDAADPAVIDSMFASAAAITGGPGGTGGKGADIVVVNAGRGLKGSAVDSDVSQWEEMIRTNLVGAALLIRAAGEKFTAAVTDPITLDGSWTKHARDIVVLGSTVGRNVSPFSSMYGATKFGLHGLTEGTRRELGPKGIRVTLVAPGFVTSEFQGVAGYAQEWYDGVKQRLGPTLTPDDIARLIGFVCSQPAACHIADIMIRPTRQDYP